MNALILSAVLFAQCSDCGGRMVPVPRNPGMQPQPAPATARVEKSVDVERSYTGRFFGGKREVNIEKSVTKQAACATCDLSDLKKRIAALEAREPQQGPPGRDGKDGADGQDGEPGGVDMATVDRLVGIIGKLEERIAGLESSRPDLAGINAKLAELEGKVDDPITFELWNKEGVMEDSDTVKLGGKLKLQKRVIAKN